MRLSFYLFILTTRKRIYILFHAYLLVHVVLFQSVFMYSWIMLSFSPTVPTQYPLHQKLLPPYLYNRKILCYSMSLSPDLKQIRKILQGFFKKLPEEATPIPHFNQSWQEQYAECQRYLKERNIIQSMSRKGNCTDNGVMENFFGRLKIEMFNGKKFSPIEDFIDKLHIYISYYNSERISLKLKEMSPVRYRTHY